MTLLVEGSRVVGQVLETLADGSMKVLMSSRGSGPAEVVTIPGLGSRYSLRYMD